MKHVGIAICLLVLGLILSSPAKVRASEQITDFVSEIEVQSDHSLKILETIEYETTLAKHGIYRYLPIRYTREGSTYSLPVGNVSITDPSGKRIPFTKSSDGQNLTLKIGDPAQTFTGGKTYEITYTVDNALQNTPEGLRLYWDITGEGWNFPILQSRALLSSPGVIQKITCYSGQFGGNNGACTSKLLDSHRAEFGYDQTLTNGENFTIDIQFQGTTGFTAPSRLQQLIRFVLSYWWVTIFLALPILSFYIWYRYGRDYMFVRYNPYDQSKRTEMLKPILFRISPPFVYEPLDITPGQAGVMLDESYDMRDLTADILDLARKKFLKIEPISTKTLFKPADYNFIKLKNADSSLPNHQAVILEGLFESGKESRLSDLKGPFFKYLDRIKASVFEELFNQTCFTRDPWKFKQQVVGTFVVVGVVLFFAGQFLLPRMLESTALYLLIVLAVADTVFAYMCINALTQKTGKGFNYWLLARGLRETIKRGKWRQQIMEKHLFIEEILPFAVSLNVVDQLSRDMKELGLEPPKYMGGGGLATAVFVNSFTRDVGAGLTYNPASSKSGGGSFGGGFSGGGGGGGGGGSW